MFQIDRPDLLIYHGPSCLDGLACKWCVLQRWPDVETHMGIYGQDPPDVTGKRVLIADFSYPEEQLKAMAAQALELVVLDHHETAREHVTKLLKENVIKGTFDLNRSGAGLTWEVVWGQRFGPKLIEHIQDRDLWKFEMEKTHEVTALVASYGDDLPAWTELARMLDSGRHREAHAQGEAILRARRQDMTALMRAGIRTMIIGGERVPVCNAPFFWASEIGHELAKMSPVGWGGTYMDLSTGQRQFSLRSADKDKAPVHLIAKEYGGGGHPGAAGFTAETGWEGDVDDTEDPVQAIALRTGGGIGVQGG